MLQNSSALDAEMSDTTIQAGWKSAAVIVDAPRSCSVSSTSAAPTATPTEIESCWLTATSEVARLMDRWSMSAYAMVLRLVYWSERKKPPTRSTATIQASG